MLPAKDAAPVFVSLSADVSSLAKVGVLECSSMKRRSLKFMVIGSSSVKVMLTIAPQRCVDYSLRGSAKLA
jgi:hypothetical protein